MAMEKKMVRGAAIKRVMQKEKMPCNHLGKMGKGDKANWKRPDNAKTPRKA